MKIPLLLALFCALSCVRAAGADDRLYPATRIFVNTSKDSDTAGCSGPFETSGHLTCGHPGHVSDLRWKFLRVDHGSDVYEITRIYPSDTSTPQTDTKEAAYAGKPLVLWEDEEQKIILRPAP